MPDDRRENDVLNAVRGRELDYDKLGKFPRAADINVRAGDANGQMEKPMQIAEPRVQQEEDQVLFLCLSCYGKLYVGFLLGALVVQWLAHCTATFRSWVKSQARANLDNFDSAAVSIE